MSDTDAQVATRERLLAQVQEIILLQGNDYIKELLRENNLRIGSTKDQFAENIARAIRSGDLTQDMIDRWLQEIDGWGNQHLYIFDAPNINRDELERVLRIDAHRDLLDGHQRYEFPEQLSLQVITIAADELILAWHLGKESWQRARAEDFERNIGLERYRFEARRRLMNRSVMRFVWRLEENHCVVFISRDEEIEHEIALSVVQNFLSSLESSMAHGARRSLVSAVKAESRLQRARTARFKAEGGFVELGTTRAQGGFDQIESVRQARIAIDDDQFEGAEGMFNLAEVAGLAGPLSVQIFGVEGRLRIWAQCKRSHVQAVVSHVLGQNGP